MASGSADLYEHAQLLAWSGSVDLVGGHLKLALMASSYTPSLAADVHWSDVSAHEASLTGYTAGGVTLSSPSLVLTAANAWPNARASATSYAYGAVVRPVSANGFLYRAVAPGSTGAGPPVYPTVIGQTVADGGVTWACFARALGVFSSDPATWASLTGSASYAVIRDATSGSPSAQPLVALVTFPGSENPSAQPFDVTPDTLLGWLQLPAVS